MPGGKIRVDSGWSTSLFEANLTREISSSMV